MALPNEVREIVLKAFRPGDQLGAKEVMSRTGRGRIVYKYMAQLLKSGKLAVVRTEKTKRRDRVLYSLVESSAEVPF